MTTQPLNPVAGEQLLVKISTDGGSTFAHPAIINTTRGLTTTLSTNATGVIDLNNPSAPAQTVRQADAVDTKIDGAGLMDANAFAVWQNAAMTGNSYPCKVQVNFTGGTSNSYTLTGNYLITQFQFTGERAKMATVSITLEQNGNPTSSVA